MTLPGSSGTLDKFAPCMLDVDVPGDLAAVFVPAGTGHLFSHIDDHILYLMIRIDPDKVVPRSRFRRKPRRSPAANCIPGYEALIVYLPGARPLSIYVPLSPVMTSLLTPASFETVTCAPGTGAPDVKVLLISNVLIGG
jgi:hypothetical protein